MGTINTNNETLIIDAIGASSQIEFRQDGVLVGSVDSGGFRDEVGTILRNSLYPLNTMLEILTPGAQEDLATDLNDGFDITVTGALEFLFTTFDTCENGRTICLILRNGLTNITWPATVLWVDGDVPEFSAGIDRVIIQKITNTEYHGSLAGQEYA